MFQASIHGWPFGNDFECSGPELGTGGPPPPDLGMAGGLCWSALDRYVRGVTIPRDTRAPTLGDPLHAELYQRQVAAIAGIWPRVREWQHLPEGSWRDRFPFPMPGGDDLASRTRRAWRTVRRQLSDGQPVLLTLLPDTGGYERSRAVRQVLATAASREGRRARITVYDPDQPGNDRVHLKLNLAGSLDARTSDGEALRGFFPVAYDRHRGGVLRLQSFADRAVIGLNRTVKGRVAMAAKRGRLDLVARDKKGALIHFHRGRSGHWEGANVTEANEFGTYELHTDPVAFRTGGTLHVFGLSHVGDLLHFQLRRSWRVGNRTESRRVGARFRLQGRVAPVPGPKRSLSVIGQDDEGGLIHYYHAPFRGWWAEQVPGDPVSTDPVAVRIGDTLHVVSADASGRVLHWRRQAEWTMTDTDAGDGGPHIRLAGEPKLHVADGAVRIFGRTTDGALAIMTLGRDGRWQRQCVGEDLAGDPDVTEGPAGVHAFAPAGRDGLVHAWRQGGEWTWEDIMETRPALQGSASGVSELACWGSASEIRVFDRRQTRLRALTWRPDYDWVVDPIADEAGQAPSLFHDHEGLPHLVLTDRWGNVLHVEKDDWQEPGRDRPRLDGERSAPVEEAVEAPDEGAAPDAPAEAAPVDESTGSVAPADDRAAAEAAPIEVAAEPEEELADEEAEEWAQDLELVSSLELEPDEPADDLEPDAEPVEKLDLVDAGAPEPASALDDIERFGDIKEPPGAEAPEPEPVAPDHEAPAAREADEVAVVDDVDDVDEFGDFDDLDDLDDFDDLDDLDDFDDSAAREAEETADDLPLLDDEPVAATAEADAQASSDHDDLAFLDFDDDDLEEEPPAEGVQDPEDDRDLPYLEVEDGDPGEDLPFLDDDEDPEEDQLPVVAEAEETDQEDAEESTASSGRVTRRRVKGGPVGTGGPVEVEPMDLSLLDSWPDTESDRRKKRKSKTEPPPKNGGSPSS